MKKLIEWLKDNWDIPYWKCYWWYRDLRGFIYYNFNLHHLRLVKEAWLSYPFEYEFMYDIQKAKLIEMNEYFKKTGYVGQKSIEQIALCIRLIDIIREEDIDTKVYVNTRNWKRFRPDWSDENLWSKDTHEECEEWRKHMFEKFPGELRCAKAKKLYYMLLERYADTWWD